MSATLTNEDIQAALTGLPGWQYISDDSAIQKTFMFKNFARAFAFMTDVAEKAEQLKHHPDWSNSWNKVEVTLSTHSAGGITNLDIKLATFMESLLPDE